MDNKHVRWRLRFEQYNNALKTIEEVVPAFQELTQLEQDGLIRRFEFTFELAWKVMQDYLEYAGYNGIKGPRACLTQMAQENLVDGFLWEAILEARNKLSHVYDEEESRGYLQDIVNDFVPVFKAFQKQMEKLL